jgi:hypothetical protein
MGQHFGKVNFGHLSNISLDLFGVSCCCKCYYKKGGRGQRQSSKDRSGAVSSEGGGALCQLMRMTSVMLQGGGNMLGI